MECPFCNDTVREAVFAQSDNFLALYNIAPIFPGHSLIIPGKHIESIQNLSDEQLSEMIIFSRKVTDGLLQVFKAESFNWSLQEKESAGQTIAHLHWHIVLRFPGDMPNPGDWYPKIKSNYREMLDSEFRTKLNAAEMKQIVKKLRGYFNYG